MTSLNVDEIRSFYIQLLDMDTGYVLDEIECGSWTIRNIMSAIKDCDLSEYSEKDFVLDLHEVEIIMKIKQLRPFIDTNIMSLSSYYNLISVGPNDDLPYLTHTGREYYLMKNRLKPLSVFIDTIPEDKSTIFPRDLFDRLLHKDLVVRTEYCEVSRGQRREVLGMRVSMFALQSESWRLHAYTLLRNTAARDGWHKSLIRMEGFLLGYTDDQISFFQKKYYS